MTEATPRQGSTRWATFAQAAGIVGIVICLIFIVGVWLGRGSVAGAIDDLGTGVGGGFDRAIAATETVASRLDAAATEAGSIATDATTISTTSNPAPNVVTRLADRVGQFADAYRGLRVRYGEVRESVSGAITSLQRVARFVPGLDVPEQPADALGAIDAKLQAIDDAITSTWQSFQEGASSAAATAVATKTAAMQTFFTDAATSARALGTRLTAAQTRATGAADTLRTILLVMAVAISVLLVWVLVLNVALWQLGRHWRRDAMGAGPVTGAPPVVEASPEAAAPPQAEPSPEAPPSSETSPPPSA